MISVLPCPSRGRIRILSDILLSGIRMPYLSSALDRVSSLDRYAQPHLGEHLAVYTYATNISTHALQDSCYLRIFREHASTYQLVIRLKQVFTIQNIVWLQQEGAMPLQLVSR
jgi:hypothetical protein